ncbi:haloacid dehalogenase-like hydrolase (plasmid) [Roseobacteraceae bacterium NS-SX3]
MDSGQQHSRQAGPGQDGAGALRVLAVDLDHTLVQTDLLHESFWAAAAQSWRAPFAAAWALLRGGRAGLKRALAERGRVDAALLPYNHQVTAYVRAWRAAGGRTALVTAADQALAEAVARQVGLFDEVHGSDGRTNLKGANKARFLAARYGPRGFAYAGDSRADLKVWRQAGKAVTVTASAPLRARAAELAPAAEHLEVQAPPPGAYLQLLEPRRWAWNLLLFLPVLAAGPPWAAAPAALLAALALGLADSGAAVLRGLLRLAPDRAGPDRGSRPFAAGQVPLAHGLWLAAGTLLAALALAAALGWPFVLLAAGVLAVRAAATAPPAGPALQLGLRLLAGAAVAAL